jgi:hypothetical protein
MANEPKRPSKKPREERLQESWRSKKDAHSQKRGYGKAKSDEKEPPKTGRPEMRRYDK